MAEVVANCDHLARLKFSPVRPHAFTEHGAIMAANVLNSKRAIEVSLMVVRAFVRQRQLLVSHADLARKLDELERKSDDQFAVVFDALRQLSRRPVRAVVGLGSLPGDPGASRRQPKCRRQHKGPCGKPPGIRPTRQP